MPSVGQTSYLNTLMKDKVVPPQFQGLNTSGLSVSEASELIKILIAQPAKAKVFTKAKADLVPTGFYSYENELYQVVTSAMGNRYAKALVVKDGKGSWSGYAPEITPLLELSHLISLTEAKELGKDFGFCIVCGRTLTDPESIDNGIGPICAERFA